VRSLRHVASSHLRIFASSRPPLPGPDASALNFSHLIWLSWNLFSKIWMSRRLLLSLIGLACFGSLADAQVQAIRAASEPDWSAPDIVVTAATPRMRRLVKGASTVWKLGVIPLPQGRKWNTAAVTHVQDNADRLLLPPSTAVGLFQAMEAASRSHLRIGGRSTAIFLTTLPLNIIRS
jgi:hypothetical protein